MIIVVILSFDFPPAQVTAAQRPKSWIKEFTKVGFHSTLICRNIAVDAKKEATVVMHNGYEIHMLKTANLIQWKYPPKGLINRAKRKVMTKLHSLLHDKLGPFATFLKYTDELCKSANPSNTIIIATGKPFFMFKIADLMYKRYKIQWIADYRDDWTTTELPFYSKFDKFMNNSVSYRQEKAWLQSAFAVTSVSSHYVEKIKRLLGEDKKYCVVQNGYFLDEHIDNIDKGAVEPMSFLYVGSLYSSQDIVTFFSAFKEAVRACDEKLAVSFNFLGTVLDSSRLALISANMPTNVKLVFHKRLPKADALELQRKCAFAVIIPHTGLKGIPSSKIYEFIAGKMPIIYYPTDKDIIEQICTECNLGITAESYTLLVDVLTRIMQGNYQLLKPHEKKIASYSRAASTTRLIDLIESVFTNELV